MSWKINTWKAYTGDVAISVAHCGNANIYNIKHHELETIFTCNKCKEKVPEEQISILLKITRVIKKYDLDY